MQFLKSGLPTTCWISHGQKLHPIVSRPIFCVHIKQNLYVIKNKTLAVAFNSTSKYIEDVLSIKICYFHTYFDSICPSEPDIKDTTSSVSPVSYLDIILEWDFDGNLTTKLSEKRHDFSFSLVTFLIYVAIYMYLPSSPAYGDFVSQLIRYERTCFTYGQLFEVRLSTDKQDNKTGLSIVSIGGHLFVNSMVSKYNLTLRRILTVFVILIVRP